MTVTAAEAEQRASAMTRLPKFERNVLIALGVLASRVIDARHRFDRDRECAGVPVTVTLFEGAFGPGDEGPISA